MKPTFGFNTVTMLFLCVTLTKVNFHEWNDQMQKEDRILIIRVT